jgi:hypothetical protein
MQKDRLYSVGELQGKVRWRFSHYQCMKKDAEGLKEVQWGLPSPFFGEQRKDNPKAKNEV